MSTIPGSFSFMPCPSFSRACPVRLFHNACVQPLRDLRRCHLLLLSSPPPFFLVLSVFAIVVTYVSANLYVYISMFASLTLIFSCSVFDMDFLNTAPCIWPETAEYYYMWILNFFMPVAFTMCQLLLYGIVFVIQKLLRKPSCRSKRSCARKLCCCCPSTTYGLRQFRHRLVKVWDV